MESIEKDLKLLPQQQAKKSSTASSSSSLSKSAVDSLLDLTNEVDSLTGYKEESIGRGSGSCPSLDFLKPLHNSTSKSFGVGLGHVTNAVIDTKLVVEEKCKNVYLYYFYYLLSSLIFLYIGELLLEINCLFARYLEY